MAKIRAHPLTHSVGLTDDIATAHILIHCAPFKEFANPPGPQLFETARGMVVEIGMANGYVDVAGPGLAHRGEEYGDKWSKCQVKTRRSQTRQHHDLANIIASMRQARDSLDHILASSLAETFPNIINNRTNGKLLLPR